MSSSMKCFKSFFKHTWHPQQMDNASKFVATPRTETHNETELGEVKITATSTVATSASVVTIEEEGKIPCKNGGCKSSMSRGEARLPESPWHLLKTIFLISVIAALVIWIIVYTLLAQYQIL